jgi:hypothetical protein
MACMAPKGDEIHRLLLSCLLRGVPCFPSATGYNLMES